MLLSVFLAIGAPWLVLRSSISPEFHLSDISPLLLAASVGIELVCLALIAVAVLAPDRLLLVRVPRLVAVAIVGGAYAGLFGLVLQGPSAEQQCLDQCKIIGKSGAWVPKPMTGHRTRAGWRLDNYCRCE